MGSADRQIGAEIRRSGRVAPAVGTIARALTYSGLHLVIGFTAPVVANAVWAAVPAAAGAVSTWVPARGPRE